MTYLDRFNDALEAAKAGNHEMALSFLNSVFAPDSNNKLPPAESITEEFFFEVRLRTAICFMNLAQWNEALGEFENPQMSAYAKLAGPAQLFTYHVHYATTLFENGNWAQSDSHYAEALAIAVNELQDNDSLEKAWRLRLEAANRAQEWKMLLNLTLAAVRSSKSNGISSLQEVCTEMACLAYRGLYRFADARRGAELVRSRLQAQHACPARVGRWTHFIDDLNREAA